MACYQEAIRLKPDLGDAYYYLAGFGSDGLSNDDIDAIRNLLADSRLPPQEKRSLHFALADVLDQRDCCEEAFEHYRQGNNFAGKNSSSAGGHSIPARR